MFNVYVLGDTGFVFLLVLFCFEGALYTYDNSEVSTLSIRIIRQGKLEIEVRFKDDVNDVTPHTTTLHQLFEFVILCVV